jgi:hypothetical protein
MADEQDEQIHPFLPGAELVRFRNCFPVNHSCTAATRTPATTAGQAGGRSPLVCGVRPHPRTLVYLFPGMFAKVTIRPGIGPSSAVGW